MYLAATTTSMSNQIQIVIMYNRTITKYTISILKPSALDTSSFAPLRCVGHIRR